MHEFFVKIIISADDDIIIEKITLRLIFWIDRATSNGYFLPQNSTIKAKRIGGL